MALELKEAEETYAELSRELISEGALYEDEDFPATDASIGIAELEGQLEWKRPKELNPDAEHFVGGISRFDLVQGKLSDCWFVAVLAMISNRPKLLKQIMPEVAAIQSDEYCGIFRARFWTNGKWVEVIIDDRLPVKKGQKNRIFTRSDDPKEFWSSLVEKAFAKFRGSFESMNIGWQTEGMVDLTGGISETYDLAPEKREDNLEDLLCKFHSNWCLMGCSMNKKDRPLLLPNGLTTSHAYSITKIGKVSYQGGEQTLVRLRNTWGGKYEWNGAWSDKSSEWDSVSDQEKKKLGYVVRDDGEFWMPFEDWVQEFDSLSVCHLIMDSIIPEEHRGSIKWHELRFHGEWKKGSNAGGSWNNKDTYHTNPQYRIALTDPDPGESDGLCSVYISLLQKERRKAIPRYASTGFQLYKVDQQKELTKEELFKMKKAALRSYATIREVGKYFKLAPGNYILIPTIFKPDEEAKFLVRVKTLVKK